MTWLDGLATQEGSDDYQQNNMEGHEAIWPTNNMNEYAAEDVDRLCLTYEYEGL